jgi:hypothetical protein
VRRKPGERWDCEGCGEPLVGAQPSTNPNTVMPVKMAPEPNGNILIQQVEGVLTGFVFGNPVIRGALQDAGVVMRINHFADCPARERFQR